MLSRMKRSLDAALGRGCYTHEGREFMLDADTRDALLKAAEVREAFRQAYIGKCQKEQKRVSDPLHPAAIGRGDMPGRWRDRFLAFVRRAVSPVFSVTASDTMKEYRIFSRRIVRLRAEGVMRDHLDAIEAYSRLIHDETPAPLAGGLPMEKPC